METDTTLSRMALFDLKAPITVEIFEENSNEENYSLNSDLRTVKSPITNNICKVETVVKQEQNDDEDTLILCPSPKKTKTEDGTETIKSIDQEDTHLEFLIDEEIDIYIKTNGKRKKVTDLADNTLRENVQQEHGQANFEHQNIISSEPITDVQEINMASEEYTICASPNLQEDSKNAKRDPLKSITKFLIPIMQSYNYYDNIVKNKKSTKKDIDLSRKQFLEVKYNNFKAAYETVFSTILCKDYDDNLIEEFLRNTIKTYSKKIKMESTSLRNLYEEMIKWAKNRKCNDPKYHVNKINNTKLNGIVKQRSNPFKLKPKTKNIIKPITQIVGSNNIDKSLIGDPKTHCTITPGPGKQEQVNINIDTTKSNNENNLSSNSGQLPDIINVSNEQLSLTQNEAIFDNTNSEKSVNNVLINAHTIQANIEVNNHEKNHHQVPDSTNKQNAQNMRRSTTPTSIDFQNSNSNNSDSHHMDHNQEQVLQVINNEKSDISNDANGLEQIQNLLTEFLQNKSVLTTIKNIVDKNNKLQVTDPKSILLEIINENTQPNLVPTSIAPSGSQNGNSNNSARHYPNNGKEQLLPVTNNEELHSQLSVDTNKPKQNTGRTKFIENQYNLTILSKYTNENSKINRRTSNKITPVENLQIINTSFTENTRSDIVPTSIVPSFYQNGNSNNSVRHHPNNGQEQLLSVTNNEQLRSQQPVDANIPKQNQTRSQYMGNKFNLRILNNVEKLVNSLPAYSQEISPVVYPHIIINPVTENTRTDIVPTSIAASCCQNNNNIVSHLSNNNQAQFLQVQGTINDKFHSQLINNINTRIEDYVRPQFLQNNNILHNINRVATGNNTLPITSRKISPVENTQVSSTRVTQNMRANQVHTSMESHNYQKGNKQCASHFDSYRNLQNISTHENINLMPNQYKQIQGPNQAIPNYDNRGVMNQYNQIPAGQIPQNIHTMHQHHLQNQWPTQSNVATSSNFPYITHCLQSHPQPMSSNVDLNHINKTNINGKHNQFLNFETRGPPPPYYPLRNQEPTSSVQNYYINNRQPAPRFNRSSVSTDSGFASPVECGENLIVDDILNELFDQEQSTLPAITHVMSLNPQKVKCKGGPCHICGKMAKEMCSGCYSTYYCSTNCQKLDWRIHQYNCQKANRAQ